jgi:hypothetical protein
MDAAIGPLPSTATESHSGAWEESSLGAIDSASRLSPGQPDFGLVWVTRGHLTVTSARGETLDLPKGSVVAYRLGDSLTWAASPGSHVRWCQRDVRLREGEVRPWTPPVREEGGEIVAARRRPWMALASLALLWIAAITVAWCVSATHSSRVEGRTRPTPTTPKTLAATDDIKSFFEDAGFSVRSVKVFAKSNKANVYVTIPSLEAAETLDDADGPLTALGEGAKALLGRHGMREVTVFPLKPESIEGDGLKDAHGWEHPTKLFADGRVAAMSAPPARVAPVTPR